MMWTAAGAGAAAAAAAPGLDVSGSSIGASSTGQGQESSLLGLPLPFGVEVKRPLASHGSVQQCSQQAAWHSLFSRSFLPPFKTHSVRYTLALHLERGSSSNGSSSSDDPVLVLEATAAAAPTAASAAAVVGIGVVDNAGVWRGRFTRQCA